MYESKTPAWLRFCERRLRWLAVPNISILLVTLQALGFLFVYLNPVWLSRLALAPDLVLHGQVWRLLTFLAMPVSLSAIWLFFELWFLYFIVNLVESEWGAFRTTFYILVSVVVTIIFSFIFRYPVTNAIDFYSTLFLAAAALFPNVEIQLFFVLPVKIKWLGWLTMAYVAFEFFQGFWIDRFYLLAIYSNYLLFFGPAIYSRAKDLKRRWNFKRKLK